MAIYKLSGDGFVSSSEAIGRVSLFLNIFSSNIGGFFKLLLLSLYINKLSWDSENELSSSSKRNEKK